jgi:hypothetical protein
MILVADQIEGRTAAPRGLGQGAAQGSTVDRPLSRMNDRLCRVVEILGKQLENTLAGQFEKAFRVGSDLRIEGGGIELGEQRTDRLASIRREGVDIDQAGDLPITAPA